MAARIAVIFGGLRSMIAHGVRVILVGAKWRVILLKKGRFVGEKCARVRLWHGGGQRVA